MPAHGCHRVPARTGFTLMESLIAVTLLAMTVLAIAQAVVAGQMNTQESLIAMRATALAEAMLEEVMSKPYADPQGSVTLGPDSGESSRGLYDNMDDYHGFTQAANALSDRGGVLYANEYQRFSRSVSCGYTTTTITGLASAVAGLNITVSVTASDGAVWTFTRFVPAP